MFISTFATNLSKDRRAERTTDTDWRERFSEMENNLVKCPKCGKITFSESGKCFECSAPLSKKKPGSTGGNNGRTSRKHFATFRVLSAGEPKRDMTVYVSDVATGSSISKNLSSGNLFKVLYNKKNSKNWIKEY